MPSDNPINVMIADHPPRKWYRPTFTPFDKRGNIRLVYVTDPWWKKSWAKIRGDGVWHKMGTMTDD